LALHDPAVRDDAQLLALASLKPKHLEGWKHELQELIDENAGERVDGRIASHRPRSLAAETLFTDFRILHEELKVTPQPRNLKEDHVRRLVQH
jgi:hypothetical protein